MSVNLKEPAVISNVYEAVTDVKRDNFNWTFDIVDAILRKSAESNYFCTKLFNNTISYQMRMSMIDKIAQGKNEDDTTTMNLVLSVEVKNVRKNIKVQYEFSIIDAAGKEVNIRYNNFKIHQKRDTVEVDDFVTIRQLREKSAQLTPDNKLTISCKITAVDEAKSTDNYRSEVDFNCTNSRLPMYENLLHNAKYGDVMIIEGNLKWMAHKAILAESSTVFARIISDKEAENDGKINSVIEIVEVPVYRHVVYDMLKFIYTGEFDCSNRRASMDLLKLAAKYDLQQLKLTCEKFIRHQLDIDNVVETLEYAHNNCLEELKNRAIELISIKASFIIKRPDFKKLSEFYPELVAEILECQVNDPWQPSLIDYSSCDPGKGGITLKLININEDGEEQVDIMTAHKTVLRQNPVFKRLLSEPNFTRKNCITIKHCPYQYMAKLLKFLYTQFITDDLSGARIFYYYFMADCFQIEDLKIWCKRHFRKLLCGNNDVRINELAHTAIMFSEIGNNQALIRTKWNSLLSKENPFLKTHKSVFQVLEELREVGTVQIKRHILPLDLYNYLHQSENA